MAVTHGTASAVAANTPTTVATYTPGSSAALNGFLASGTTEAKFTLAVGGTTYYVYRTSPGDRNAYVLAPVTSVAGGTAITISVEHDQTGTHNFEASIITS